VEHKWPAKYLRRTENTYGRAGLHAYKKQTLNRNNKQFLVDKNLLQNSSRRTSKAWSCNIGKVGHQGGKTRIEEEIERLQKTEQETRSRNGLKDDYEEGKK
jgi:hypothetical protein